MSFLVNMFSRLSEDEEEVALEQMRKLYGPLIHWSLMFPLYGPGKLVNTLILWLVSALLYSGHFALLTWAVLLELETLELWGLLFNFNLLLSFGIVTLFFLNYERRNVAENHRRYGNKKGSYPGPSIYLEKEPIRIKKEVDRETMMFTVLPAFVVVLAGTLLIVPYVAKLGSEAVDPYTKNGVNKNLPIPLCYPFPTHDGILHLIVVALQLATGGILAIVVSICLVSLIRFTQQMKYEYKVLGYAMRTLFKKAARLYRINHPGNQRVDNFDQEYQEYVRQILRCCVIHHHNIVEFMDVFSNTQLRWPAAFGYAVGTASMGLSLVTIVSSLRDNDYNNVIVFSLLGIGEVLSILMMSLIGETITTESKKLRDQVYDIDWYKLDIQNRKIMLNFQVGITEPAIFKAGGLVDICLDTFSSIMNSAYSFFNLMNVGIE